ncbi:MAG: zinc ribbon domain-containing protein [Gemmatimonadaceae bacterium]|nr:zinc ribbon domain-containing protein [Gemmatimonadaceae bacterium]
MHCTQCGALHQPADTYCPSCGANLIARTPPQATITRDDAKLLAREHQHEEGYVILAGLVLVVVAVVVGGVAMMIVPGLHPGVALVIGAIPGAIAAAKAHEGMRRTHDQADAKRKQ